jgi:hypothetical protein
MVVSLRAASLGTGQLLPSLPAPPGNEQKMILFDLESEQLMGV